jgi:hypothetical protein
VEKIPHMVEGCVGDSFYDFCYDIDKIVVAGPPRVDDATRMGGASRPPSPKRATTDFTESNTEETSEGFVQASQTESVRHLTNCESIPENEPVEQESEEDNNIGDQLLLETIHRENEASTKVASNKWLIPCPILNSNSIFQDICKSMTLETFISLLFPCEKSPIEEVWPPLPTITDVTGDFPSPLAGSPDYLVQSPDSSPDIVQDDTYGPRFSSRLQDSINTDTMEKASGLSKKRNLEGNHDSAPNPLNNKIPNGNFATVNLVRDLELARNSLVSRQKTAKLPSGVLFIESNEGTTTPLSMDWISSDDNEDTSFTLVESRKKKKKEKEIYNFGFQTYN